MGSTALHFSIVIPTRERCDTLRSSLASALAQQYDNYEVVVSDNASNDQTRQLCEGFQSERLRYINPGQRLAMSENWEFALKTLKGGWVTFLGDDDALVPGALGRVAEIVRKTGVKAVRCNVAGYSWPGMSEATGGELSVSTRRGYRLRGSAAALSEVLRGERNYTDLPTLYNGGFIDTELIRTALVKGKPFYRSLNPDVYSAMVFALLTDHYVYCFESLAINGASRHSGGTAAFGGKETKGPDPSKLFLSEPNLDFHDAIPLDEDGVPVREIHAHVLEAYLQAERFHRPEVINPSYEEHLAIILRNSRRSGAALDAWATKFASKHCLDLNNVRGMVANRPMRQRQRRRAARILGSRIRRMTMKGSAAMPIANSYEAAVLIGAFYAGMGGFRYRSAKQLNRLCSWLTRRFKR